MVGDDTPVFGFGEEMARFPGEVLFSVHYLCLLQRFYALDISADHLYSKYHGQRSLCYHRFFEKKPWR